MKVRSSLMVLFIMFALTGKVAAAKALFVEDFEAGLSDAWIIGHLDGQSVWEVVELDGNSVLKVDSLGFGWTGATVDEVASVKDYNELWATCKFRAEQDIQSCNELGLLTNPDVLTGNWYLSTCEGGAEIGIDQCAVSWHSRIAYPWELDQWYNMKVMVSKDGTMCCRMWPVGDDEPTDWNTEVTMTTHLDEDGVGLMSYNGVTYFDDVIVAATEDSLVMTVSPQEKLTTVWGAVKSE